MSKRPNQGEGSLQRNEYKKKTNPMAAYWMRDSRLSIDINYGGQSKQVNKW